MMVVWTEMAGNTGNGKKGKNVRVIQKVKLARPYDWLHGIKVEERKVSRVISRLEQIDG